MLTLADIDRHLKEAYGLEPTKPTNPVVEKLKYIEAGDLLILANGDRVLVARVSGDEIWPHKRGEYEGPWLKSNGEHRDRDLRTLAIKEVLTGDWWRTRVM